MSTIAYLLDEHVNPRIKHALQQHAASLQVWRIGEASAPPLRSPDPVLLLWCEANSVSLVTNNRKSIPKHLLDHLAAGHHVPGIFVLNDDMTLGETVQELIAIWGVSEAEEYTDQIRYLPISR